MGGNAQKFTSLANSSIKIPKRIEPNNRLLKPIYIRDNMLNS